ncbi:MAG: CD3072 family TudS-related putative desulfidase [Candidatus Aenigmatarchaeota archaeon]
MERGNKIVFVSHCILNQNARSVGGEKYSGVVKEILELFIESGVGIIQIPCPQLEFNEGLNRKSSAKDSYENVGFRSKCQKLSLSVIQMIENYVRKKYEILGILGIEQSSTCGVYQIQNGKRSVPGKGIFIEELEKEMQKKNFQVPIIGVNLNNIFSSLEKVQSLLKFS